MIFFTNYLINVLTETPYLRPRSNKVVTAWRHNASLHTFWRIVRFSWSWYSNRYRFIQTKMMSQVISLKVLAIKRVLTFALTLWRQRQRLWACMRLKCNMKILLALFQNTDQRIALKFIILESQIYTSTYKNIIWSFSFPF